MRLRVALGRLDVRCSLQTSREEVVVVEVLLMNFETHQIAGKGPLRYFDLLPIFRLACRSILPRALLRHSRFGMDTIEPLFFSSPHHLLSAAPWRDVVEINIFFDTYIN